MNIAPVELLSICNAAMMEMTRRPDDFKRSKPRLNELYKWLNSIDWDTPYDQVIIIDELPF